MLRMGSSVVPMSVDGTTFSYLSSDLPMCSWVNSSFYDIEFADGTTVESVLRTTGGFDALDPPILAEGLAPTPLPRAYPSVEARPLRGRQQPQTMGY